MTALHCFLGSATHTTMLALALAFHAHGAAEVSSHLMPCQSAKPALWNRAARVTSYNVITTSLIGHFYRSIRLSRQTSGLSRTEPTRPRDRLQPPTPQWSRREC